MSFTTISKNCSSAYSRGNKDGESTKSLWISYPDHKRLKIERQDFELALNCPGHCLIFDRRVRSYREKLCSTFPLLGTCCLQEIVTKSIISMSGKVVFKQSSNLYIVLPIYLIVVPCCIHV
ncbi:uncharacterized protein LOC131311362 isoform X2 [Rhododendron vialii]|uniref:uncharacterized protein LOC131311362 isoform X2 n=1 Tax=Rhododendron vialii TaxID=182163 RepID=UPI00265E38E9|nr:uncharacterized protein LOC131311362 isoform X2 [Rhododendron vialii]XP_058194771.1 uncharacterized protein LOC131311362 isoform X2 [Rhododendron vialii]